MICHSNRHGVAGISLSIAAMGPSADAACIPGLTVFSPHRGFFCTPCFVIESGIHPARFQRVRCCRKPKLPLCLTNAGSVSKIFEGKRYVYTSLAVHRRALPPAFAECCLGGSRNLRGVCRAPRKVSRTRSQNPVWGFGEPFKVRLPLANLLGVRQTSTYARGRAH